MQPRREKRSVEIRGRKRVKGIARSKISKKKLHAEGAAICEEGGRFKLKRKNEHGLDKEFLCRT
jgi:hypothetical protein